MSSLLSFSPTHLGDGGVPQDVVGGGRFLDPQGLEFRKPHHPVDGFPHIPPLVGIDHLEEPEGTSNQPTKIADVTGRWPIKVEGQ